MICRMIYRMIALVLLPVSALVLSSCGSDSELPIMAGNTQAAAVNGEGYYQTAKQADDAGKVNLAIKLYNKTATKYPFAKSAPLARYRQAQLLEQKGEILDAFKAYDEFLSRFQGSGLYSAALQRQASLAQSAADGNIKTSFLGLKSKLSLEKTVDMLNKVRNNAPHSHTASKAQFTIGELYVSSKKTKEAIAAYRKLVLDQPDSPEAPESLFRVGLILMQEADMGNQNQANLDLAREAFNDYLLQYPNHSRNAEAHKLIAALGNRDLQRTYDIAEFYQKTGKTESAKVYYRDLLKRSGSGKLHDQARTRLKELGE
jgi:outer membrane protein assembly factor BamD (BamD/ComL family)